MIRPNDIEAAEPARFSRRWWLSQGRHWLWVVVISVLVWIYADNEFTDSRSFTVKLRLYTSAARDVIIRDRKDVELTITVRGNHRSLETFQDWLNARGSMIMHDPASWLGAGRHTVSIVELLAREAATAGAGITIHGAIPSQIDMVLVPAVRRDAAVEFVYAGAIASWTANPQRLSFRIAEEDLAKLDPAAALIIRTERTILPAVLPDGPLQVPIVPVVAGAAVEPAQPGVQIVIKASEPVESRAYDISVFVLMPATLIEDNTWTKIALRQDRPQWRRRITLNGPRTDLDKLKPENLEAYVILTDNEVKAADAEHKLPVHVRLPDGLRLKVEVPPEPVTFRLGDRASP